MLWMQRWKGPCDFLASQSSQLSRYLVLVRDPVSKMLPERQHVCLTSGLSTHLYECVCMHTHMCEHTHTFLLISKSIQPFSEFSQSSQGDMFDSWITLFINTEVIILSFNVEWKVELFFSAPTSLSSTQKWQKLQDEGPSRKLQVVGFALQVENGSIISLFFSHLCGEWVSEGGNWGCCVKQKKKI